MKRKKKCKKVKEIVGDISTGKVQKLCKCIRKASLEESHFNDVHGFIHAISQQVVDFF